MKNTHLAEFKITRGEAGAVFSMIVLFMLLLLLSRFSHVRLCVTP